MGSLPLYLSNITEQLANFLTDKSLELKVIIYLERIVHVEPLANNVGEWAINYFNPERKSIVNTYFQTETGGVITAPRDEDGLIKIILMLENQIIL